MNVKVAAIEMNCIPYKKEENLETAAKIVRACAQAGAVLIVLPELFSTGYSVADQDYELSEPVPYGKTTGWMEALSQELGVFLVGAIIERSEESDDALYDTSALTGPEGYIGKYRKICLWGSENERFRSGNEYPVFDIGFARLGLQICYEVGFPEGARTLTLSGATMIAYSAAFSQHRVYAWEIASRARALENGLFVVASNRYGEETDVCFAAKSRIIGPQGNVLAETTEENVFVIAEVDMLEEEQQRQAIPYLRDYKTKLFAEEIGRHVLEKQG